MNGCDKRCSRQIMWFRCGIFMQPRSLERKFWVSDVYHTWSLRVDVWCFWFRMLNGTVAFVQNLALPDGAVKSSAHGWIVALLSLDILQYIWMRSGYNYSRWRALLMLINRALRFATFAMLLWLSRQQSESQTRNHHLEHSNSTLIPPALLDLRALLLLSMAIPSFMQGHATPLSFTTQIIAQALNLLLLIGFYLPSAVAAAGHLQPRTTIYKDACHWLNVSIMSVEAILAGTTANLAARHQDCEERAVPALLLFFMIFLGAVVPVYTAYRWELHVKEVFLYQLCQQPPSAPGGCASQEAAMAVNSSEICPDPHDNIQHQQQKQLGSFQMDGSGVHYDNDEYHGYHEYRTCSEASSEDEDDLPPELRLRQHDLMVLCAAALTSWMVVMHFLDQLIAAEKTFKPLLSLLGVPGA